MMKFPLTKDNYTGIVKKSPFNGGALIDIPNVQTDRVNYVHLNQLYFLLQEDDIQPIMVRKIWESEGQVHLVVENIITGQAGVITQGLHPKNYHSAWGLFSCDYLGKYFENETQRWYRTLLGNTM